MVGKLFLIIGPSGVGKGTIQNMLKKRHPEFIFPLSATTRKKRPGEKNGEIYYFVTQEQFDEHIKKNELLEWAVVHKNDRYGLLKKQVLDIIKQGKVIIREVDVQGWKSILQTEVGKNTISLFIMPSSLQDLRERIVKRAPISEEELDIRLKDSSEEIEKGKNCDYHVISRDNQQEKLYNAIENIILTEMQK